MGYPLAAIAVAVAVWAAAVELLEMPPYILPSPLAVGLKFVDRFDLLVHHAVPTVIETVVGLALSIVFGVATAVLLVASRTMERTFMPLIVGSQCFPKVAIGPLLILWFGWGMLPKILISFIISFFPIVIQTVLGLKSADDDEIDLIRTMSPSRMQVFLKVRVPTALPYFFAGLKVSVTLALIGAIVGEFVGADRGIGYLLQYSNSQLDTALMFAGMVVLVGIGAVLYLSVVAIERVAIPWHVAVRGEGSGRAAVRRGVQDAAP